MATSAKKQLLGWLLQEEPALVAAEAAQFGHTALVELLSSWELSRCGSFLRFCDARDLARALEDLSALLRKDALTVLPESLAAHIVRVWNNSGKEELSKATLLSLEAKRRKRIETLNGYPDESVGATMDSAPFTTQAESLISEVLLRLRKLKFRNSRYIYAVDENEVLEGVLSFKDAYYADHSSPVSRVMNSKIESFRPEMALETVAKNLCWSRWSAMPVVDAAGKLLGVLSYEDLLRASGKLEKSNTQEQEQLKEVGLLVGEVFQVGISAAAFAMGLRKEK